ncbi:MAG: UDP-N-acetylmuramoyl-tripeptide--D-alanyl-D-alanine ligase [Phycisphaerales bacterium]|nr:UDP-N-acetylmuramoyl-tripeptide--D-alanyl-D-alanine ligase [Phycisphaerales bacterium]
MFDPVDIAKLTQGRWLGTPPAQAPLLFGHDTRKPLEGGMYVAIRGEAHDGHDFMEEARAAGATMALVDREIESTIPCLLVSDTIESLAVLASHWRDRLEGTRVLAITGTAGKTTTKDLLQHVLGSALRGTASPASWNNSIGGPMSLLRARPGDDYVILEMGTSSPGEIATLARCARPDVAIITLIGRGHLEGLDSLDGVRKEKLSLLDSLAPGGTAIIHEDGQDVQVPEGTTLFRHGDGAAACPGLVSRDSGVIRLNDGSIFTFPIAGRHQAINALAVIAAARDAGMEDQAISDALATSVPSKGRGAESTTGGIRFIDDAYNANPESVAAALDAFPEVESTGRRIVILGDMLELGAQEDHLHAALLEPILASHARMAIDEVILIGRAMESLAAQIQDTASLAVSHWNALDEPAMDSVVSRLASGDLVLIKASRGMRLEQIIRKTGGLESEATTA